MDLDGGLPETFNLRLGTNTHCGSGVQPPPWECLCAMFKQLQEAERALANLELTQKKHTKT